MEGIRKKYQRRSFNASDNNNEKIKETTTTTTTVIEPNSEGPITKKIVEEKVEIERDFHPKNRFGKTQRTAGRFSAIYNYKKDKDLINENIPTDNSIERDKNEDKNLSNTNKNTIKPKFRWSIQEDKVGKEPIKWRRFGRKKEEEPEEKNKGNNVTISKTVKEEKDENPNILSTKITETTIIEDNNKNKPEEKVVKTEVITTTVVKSRKEIPENENKDDKNKYRFRRDKFRANKTDEDLPQKKEEEKEKIKSEARKRKTLENSFNPMSLRLKEYKTGQNNDEKKNEKEKNNYKRNKNEKNYKDDKNIDNEDKNNNYKKINNGYKNDYKYKSNNREKNNDDNNYKTYKKGNKPHGNRKIIEEEKNDENMSENYGERRFNRLKIALNEIERVCAEETLEDDLMELFNKVLDFNSDFKNDIFFKNLNDTEKKVGNMDKVDQKKISHTFKEIETSEILSNIENADDLMNKYTNRAMIIEEEED